MASLPLNYDILSIATMHTMVQECFDFVPCNWQVQSAQAQLKQRDIITLSPTGCEKTLTFWIPLLFNNGTILIIPLTTPGEKNATELQQVQISVVNLSAATATDATLKVRLNQNLNILTYLYTSNRILPLRSFVL